jgi:hypothetical protein
LLFLFIFQSASFPSVPICYFFNNRTIFWKIFLSLVSVKTIILLLPSSTFWPPAPLSVCLSVNHKALWSTISFDLNNVHTSLIVECDQPLKYITGALFLFLCIF